MNLPESALRLTVYTGEDDRIDHRPLHEVIVEEARKQGLAGATVKRGAMGFGANSRVHTTKILRLSEDLPIIIELVDVSEKINAFKKFLDRTMKEGLVTIEKVEVVFYRHNEGHK
ncbi:DUF190 domain-containing protein [Maridesulfovibrio bastinii]|jgi:hypothetical protein|uniref:DUF190 domain-containing protein n=1 Tax=Maridesulfovibrio bastinii TaxID=47157 RepID=UPI000410BE80|nr:DUF190 domain-containing protein [Maridesulfovibrio bastinii]